MEPKIGNVGGVSLALTTIKKGKENVRHVKRENFKRNLANLTVSYAMKESILQKPEPLFVPSVERTRTTTKLEGKVKIHVFPAKEV